MEFLELGVEDAHLLASGLVLGWIDGRIHHINGITPPAPTQPPDGISLPWRVPANRRHRRRLDSRRRPAPADSACLHKHGGCWLVVFAWKTSRNASLTCDNSSCFGARTVPVGVGRQVHAREVRALPGLDGAGKATLIRILSGAVDPDGAAAPPAGTVGPCRPEIVVPI